MPTIEEFRPRELGPKAWGKELLIAQTDTYIGKVMWMDAGKSGPFQYHERKDETFYLLSGKAEVTYKTDGGVTVSVIMRQGEAYHVPPGAPHQVAALEDCVLIEASNPVFEDRVPVV